MISQLPSFLYNLKNLDHVLYPNGMTAQYTYDPVTHRLTNIKNQDSRGNVISKFDYTYDEVGNRKTMADLSGPTTYTYDNLYRLTQAQYPDTQRGTVSYGYDNVGNRTTLTQGGNTSHPTYTNANEIEDDDLGNAYGFDASGNMTGKSGTGGNTVYGWDGLNRLTSVSGTAQVAYTYNGDNIRVKKAVSGGETTFYIYDGLSVVAELDQTGQAKKTYNPGVSTTSANGNKLFYLYDGLGSVANLVDKNQNITQSYIYDAFGKANGVSKDGNGYRFVGSGGVSSDDDSNLQYMWNRWYDPKLGHFVSRDPLGQLGGINLYQYASSNPIGYIDPIGLCGTPLIDKTRIGMGIKDLLGEVNEILEGSGTIGKINKLFGASLTRPRILSIASGMSATNIVRGLSIASTVIDSLNAYSEIYFSNASLGSKTLASIGVTGSTVLAGLGQIYLVPRSGKGGANSAGILGGAGGVFLSSYLISTAQEWFNNEILDSNGICKGAKVTLF